MSKEIREIEVRFRNKTILKKATDGMLEQLKLLEPTEWNDFNKFLSSPFFVNSDRPQLVFQQFRQAIENDSYSVRGTILFKKFFGKEYEEESAIQALNKELKSLRKHILEFVIHKEVKETPQLGFRAAVMATKKRKKVKYFRKTVQRFKAYLAKQEATIMQFNDRWWADHQTYFYHSSEKFGKDGIYFEAANEHLHEFYHITLLRYYTEYLNRSHLVRSHPKWINKYQELIRKITDDGAISGIVASYLSLIHLLQHRHDPGAHASFKALYKQHYRSFSPADQLVFIKCAHNAAIHAFEKGMPGADYHLFFWARLGVLKGIFLFENTISEGDYLNVALSGATYKRFAWQLSFMDRYQACLKEEVQDTAYQLALAFYHFHQEQYREAYQILNNTFEDHAQHPIPFSLRAKPLMIRCCLAGYLKDFDSDLLEKFEKTSERLRKYVERKGILSEEKREPYHNFMVICAAIVRLKKRSINLGRVQYQAEKSKIKSRFEEQPQIISRKWLGEFIENL